MIEKILVSGLTSFTLTFFLVENFDGPFGLLKIIREFFTRMDTDGLYLDSLFGPMFGCHWCLGTWISFIVSLIYVGILAIMNDSTFIIFFLEFLFVWPSSLALAGLIHDIVMR